MNIYARLLTLKVNNQKWCHNLGLLIGSESAYNESGSYVSYLYNRLFLSLLAKKTLSTSEQIANKLYETSPNVRSVISWKRVDAIKSAFMRRKAEEAPVEPERE